MFAFQFKREIICQVPAFMVSAEEPESVRIPDLKRPKVEYTLQDIQRASINVSVLAHTSMLK